ncbi:hypothetical protein [Aquipuribacter hungaricus]|uniref:Anti-sigma factor n=2 Tax=Aquipuribacter hungaricus TaxID=545624 RepID=A0ABV7WF57_9MICO
MRPHPDVDLLALHALGEHVLDPAGLDHVAGCEGCRQTVADLAATVRSARGPEGAAAPQRVAVPAHVWQGISAELGVDPAVRPPSVGPSSLRSRPAAGSLDGVAGAAAVAGAAGPTSVVPPAVPQPARPTTGVASPEASVVGLVPRRRRAPAARLLAVAAAGLAVGATGAAVLLPRLLDDPSGTTPEPAVLAAADLVAFGAGEGTDVSGSARLAEVPRAGTPATDGGPADGGDRVLQVWLDELPDTGDGFFEAWLIDPDSGAMVSLGPVPTGAPGEVTAELAVPRGLDVAAYDLVDVSAEPLDGDPTHSGASLVRGTLGT